MARLRCTACSKQPGAGPHSALATENICWLGRGQQNAKGRWRREVIHVPCGRTWRTNHPDVLDLKVYSETQREAFPTGTRLAELGKQKGVGATKLPREPGGQIVLVAVSGNPDVASEESLGNGNVLKPWHSR
jgi:hypothetical protein